MFADETEQGCGILSLLRPTTLAVLVSMPVTRLGVKRRDSQLASLLNLLEVRRRSNPQSRPTSCSGVAVH